MNYLSCATRLACVCLAVAFLFPATCQAQLTEASLKGTVVDTFGQVVPGSTVTAKHLATGTSRVTRTDPSGTFLLAGLPPGVYGVTAEAQGFRAFSQPELRLGVGQTVEITIPLSVVTLEETVNVSGTAARVATATEGRLADSYSKAQIDELPLPQRDIFLLTKMSAGATFIPGAANSTKLSSSPVITVNGNRYRGNNYVLDGAMNTNPNNTGEPAIVPSLESVEEVQVQTLNFAVRVRPRQRRRHQRPDQVGHERDARPRVGIPPRCVAERRELLRDRERRTADFNQFGANLGGPVVRKPDVLLRLVRGDAQRDRPPLRLPGRDAGVARLRAAHDDPNSVAARLLHEFPAPAPERRHRTAAVPRSARPDDAVRLDSGHRPRAT